MTKPNFLCLGVQRGATTWLHRCLQMHPDAFLPEKKELHFFNYHWEQGLDWYESHFSGSDAAAAVGEITPNYLHEAPLERIQSTLPDARMIVILREPVSRAYSAYRLLNERYAGMTFNEACESGDYLIGHSLYAEKLRRLYSLYPRQNVHIQLYDDVSIRPHRVYREVCEFLSLKEIPLPKEVNQTYNHIMFPSLQQGLRRMKLHWLIEVVKWTPLGDAIKRQSKHKQRKHIEADKQRILSNEIRARFDDDIRQVEELIGRDLSHWGSSSPAALVAG